MALGRSDDAPTSGGGRNYTKLVMALCLISAVGIAGTTYESTLQTDPDEVIDVKHSWLPIGKEKVKDFKNPDRSQSNSASSGGGGGSSEEPPPCSTGIIGILASIFPMLIPPCGPFYLLGLLLPLLLLLVALALLYRYRRQVIAPGIAVYLWLRDLTETTRGGDTVNWPPDNPANDVHGAWLAMVQRTNLDRPWTRTPAECARAAVDTGMDSEAVERVTGLFEEVRYGGAPLTDERRQQAREWRRRLEDHGGLL